MKTKIGANPSCRFEKNAKPLTPMHSNSDKKWR